MITIVDYDYDYELRIMIKDYNYGLQLRQISLPTASFSSNAQVTPYWLLVIKFHPQRNSSGT